MLATDLVPRNFRLRSSYVLKSSKVLQIFFSLKTNGKYNGKSIFYYDRAQANLMPIPQVGFVLILSNLTDHFHHRNPAATPLLTPPVSSLQPGAKRALTWVCWILKLRRQSSLQEMRVHESPLTMYLRGESKIEKLGKFRDPYLVGC